MPIGFGFQRVLRACGAALETQSEFMSLTKGS